MGKFIDLTGQVFGRLTVLRSAGENTCRCLLWACKCECGREIIVRGDSLRNGRTHSCNCLQKESRTTHGQSYSRHYRLWMSAKSRAKKAGVPFELELQDIPPIPEFCPVLHLRLGFGYKVPTDRSPTLDRIDPKGGYTPRNVRIISRRANMLKSDATLHELSLILQDAEKLVMMTVASD